MSIREICILIGCLFVFLFFMTISIMLTEKKKSSINLDDIVNGRPALTKNNLRKDIQEKIQHSSLYQKHLENLDRKLKLTYNTEETPESIVKFELMMLIGGLGFTLLLHLIFNFILITIMALAFTAYAVTLKGRMLTSKLKQKESDFDRLLPTFETNMLLGLQAGASLQSSMQMAIKTIPDGLVQVEFKQLLLESKTYTDNVALPYMKLSQRVPTKDCQRFANIVISGIRNGNSMSEILESESEYMTQQVLNKIREQGEKNSVKATAISSGLVFLPLIVIFLAPMMASAA